MFHVKHIRNNLIYQWVDVPHKYYGSRNEFCDYGIGFQIVDL